MKSLEFFKPTLATTLAVFLGWLLCVRSAQAGYTVTLQQVGLNVVATGSGAIDLTGLSLSQSFFQDPEIKPFGHILVGPAFIATGPTSSSVHPYFGVITGPASFGSSLHFTPASSGSGDMVGISARPYLPSQTFIIVPKGYRSGNALSDMATYSGRTFATLGLTPGTYVWKWGIGANQNFTLTIPPAAPTPPPTPTPRPASQAQLLNLSARMDVKTGDNVLIGGFIVTGNAAKKVVLRAIGPSLTQFDILGALADPVLELHAANGDLITTNDNWKDTQQTEIEATGIAPQNELESAIVATLDPDAYTVILSGKNATSGVGLVEVYDLDQAADAQLANVSARGLIETGSNVVIGGVILGNGAGTTNLVIRGLGPSLPLPGALADPTLELHDANGALVQSNDNWMDNSDADQTELTANQLAPTNDLESAMIVTLPTDAFTAILAGKNGATGVGLVEVYRLP
jgi:hypothetical protein